MTQRKQYDVVIVGAGPVGACLALALQNSRLRVALIEKKTRADILSSQEDFRAFALSASTLQFFKNLSLWEELEPYASPILNIKITNGDQPSHLSFFHQEGSADLQAMGAITEAYRVRHAVIKALESAGPVSEATCSGVDVYEGKTLTTLENPQEGLAQLSFEDGDVFDAQLVVAADGHHSYVRSLCGLQPARHDYGQEALITIVSHEKDHKGVAFEKFFPSGPFATLPMTNGRSGIVWIDAPHVISYLKKCSEEDFLTLLADRYPEAGMLSLDAKRASYPLILQYLETFYQRRVVFLGDAAHAIHPLAGQSLNLGFRDVGVLAEVLKNAAELGLDPGSQTLLESYQQKRRFDTLELITVTHGLNKLFSNDAPFKKLVRGLGMRFFGLVPGAAKYATRHAMGLTGAQPDTHLSDPSQ